MERITHNFFQKKQGSETSYCLKKGTPIFGDKLYLIKPIYVKRRPPVFSLVVKGKHISGFYPADAGGFFGDYKGKVLLIYLNEEGFDLFSTNLSPRLLEAKIFDQDFINDLFQARTESELVEH